LQDSSPPLPRGAPEDYLIPHGRVSPALLARLEVGAAEPVPARPASTVVVVRQAPSGPESLLVRRPSRAGFAPGAWVFPGGAVDESDGRVPPADAVVAQRWAERLGLDDPRLAWAYVVAAARETWEETGILLGAEAGPGEEGNLRDLPEAGDSGSFDAASSAGLRLEPGVLHYLAHWITPEFEARRFDTRFFLASVGARAEPRLQGGELVEMRWLSPAEAVAGYQSGDFPMLPPTIHTLRRIEGFARVDELVAAVAYAEVPVYLPRMRPHPEGVLVTVAEPPPRGQGGRDD
jgi:8-oxo-dGTP pyrophosphatase MutT (NUDIX family)